MNLVKEKLLIWLKKRNKNIIVSKDVSKYVDGLVNASARDNLVSEFERVSRLKNGSYQTPVSEVRFLELLVKLVKPKQILEIGTFMGLTSASLARAAGQSARVTTCEKDEANIAEAKKLWEKMGLADQIQILPGEARESLEKLTLTNKKFDLIYIDADKANYYKYFELSLKLCKEGSVLAMDNALWAGLVANENSSYSHARIIRSVNKLAFDNSQLTVSLVPAWDGLLLAYIEKL